MYSAITSQNAAKSDPGPVEIPLPSSLHISARLMIEVVAVSERCPAPTRTRLKVEDT